jgi:predicted membrane channel-forming protein YqfA (hemolysin III family)
MLRAHPLRVVTALLLALCVVLFVPGALELLELIGKAALVVFVLFGLFYLFFGVFIWGNSHPKGSLGHTIEELRRQERQRRVQLREKRSGDRSQGEHDSPK